MNADKLTPDALQALMRAQELPDDAGLHQHGPADRRAVASLHVPDVLKKKEAT